MANKRVSELAAATVLPSGTQFLLSRPSPTVKRTAATISFAAADKSINDSANGLLAAGFVAGDQVRVTGAANGANNVLSAAATVVSAGKIVTNAVGIVNEAAGAVVTVSKWESVRVDRDDLVDALAAARGAVTALAIVGGVVNVDWGAGEYFTLALTANVTGITFSNLPAGGCSLMIRITQGATARTVAWPASFKWAGGSPGAVSVGSGAVDVLALTTFDGGATWSATLAKDFA